MKFGRVAVGAAEGVILAHSVKAAGIDFKKGEILGRRHIVALDGAGISSVIGATLEPDDVEENAAALRLARHVAGAGIRLDRAFTGRCNLISDAPGLVHVDAVAVDAVNAVDESITVATLPPFKPVDAGEMVATVKIIPFAVSGAFLNRSLRIAAGAVRIARYLPLRVGVVSTLLPGLKPSTVVKTLHTLEARLGTAGASIVDDVRVAHDARALADAMRRLAAADLVIVFGASAVTDRRDVVPVAIELAGGKVEHLGMPVDPGNLLVLAHLTRDGAKVPVIGAPGCARSPKENGFDFVLRRFLAGLAVSGADLRRMGVGGLLNEIASRPQLRQTPDG